MSRLLLVCACFFLLFDVSVLAENKMNNKINIHLVKYEKEGVAPAFPGEVEARIYPFVRYVGNIIIDEKLNMRYEFLDEKEGLAIYNKFEEAKKDGFKGYIRSIIEPESIPRSGELSNADAGRSYWYWSGIVTKDEKDFIPIFLQNALFDKGYNVIAENIGKKYLKLKASKEIEKKELLNATILTKGEAVYQRNFKVIKDTPSYVKPQKSKKKYTAHVIEFKLHDINNHIDDDEKNMQRVALYGEYLGKVIIKNNSEIICDFWNGAAKKNLIEQFEEAKKNGIVGEKYYNEKPKSFPRSGVVEYLEDEKLWHWKGTATVEDDNFAEIFIKNTGYPYYAYNIVDDKYANNILERVHLEHGEKIYGKDYILLKEDEEGIKAIKAYMDKVVAEKIAERREEMANILRQQGHSDEEINRYFQKEK